MVCNDIKGIKVMNRRNFLKRVGVTCATAIVAPIALVKAKSKIVRVIDENGLLSCQDTSGKWKNYYGHRRIIVLDEFAKDDRYNKELRERLRAAIRNTKFIPPLRR